VQVVIAIADLVSGMELEAALRQAGFAATWDNALADGGTGGTPDVVVLDADELGERLVPAVEAWRDHLTVPGIVALGRSAQARAAAPRARVTLLAPDASPATLATAVRDAAKIRLATSMRWGILRAALKLPPTPNAPEAWPGTLLHARDADLELVRTVLRPHALHYITPTAIFDRLRDDRMLGPPELAQLRHADGTLTLRRLLRAGPLDQAAAARLVWALISLGALEPTPEVRDVATLPRRALAELRDHLRARTARLARGSHYEVLEITPAAEYPEIDHAYQLLGLRYAPAAIARFDLGDVEPLAEPAWTLIEQARSTLVDDASRGRYNDWLREHLRELDLGWAIDLKAAKVAADHYVRAQQALGAGDTPRAMSELAAACRNHPGHPEYEATLAWVRFRVQIDAGKEPRATAAAERAKVEPMLRGVRPWPRARVALALLCAASGDPDAARWHLRVALSIDPEVAGGAALAKRLGLR
jgi:hypothetical protein